jgi:hypothetical protein
VAETIAHWDIRGPQGAPGAPGTNGTNGTNGAPGINGVNGTNGTGGTRADGPCFDNTNRYVDCGNGTVTDTVTGLIWLKQADCLATNRWADGNLAAAALKDGDCGGNLMDKSSPGDWRLPTKDEWSATIARLDLGCSSPDLTNDLGTGCFLSGGGSSFAGVALDLYWSSTSYETGPSRAWSVDLVPLGDNVNFAVKDQDLLRVWPVRGGPR